MRTVRFINAAAKLSCLASIHSSMQCPRRDVYNSGPTVYPESTVEVPQFGTRRRRRQREEIQQLQDKAVIEERRQAFCSDETSPIAEPSESGTSSSALSARSSRAVKTLSEDDAETLCRGRYGFVEKPLYLPYWRQFVAELRRYEFRWKLSPGVGGVYHLAIVEHEADGERVVAQLQGDGNQCHPIADMFEGLAGVLQGDFLSFSVPFISRAVRNSNPWYLVFEAKPMIGVGSGGGSSVDKAQGGSIPIVPGAGHLAGKPVFPTACKTGYAFSVCLMEKGSTIRTPVFHEISLQALCNIHLVSIPPFLRRTDIGIPNHDFLPKDQMTMFRFVWCYLRRECRMTPVELSELDALLPAK